MFNKVSDFKIFLRFCLLGVCVEGLKSSSSFSSFSSFYFQNPFSNHVLLTTFAIVLSTNKPPTTMMIMNHVFPVA